MKLIRFIGNVIWFLTFGLSMFISEIISAILSVVFIVPIFFGIPKVHITNARFVIAPFGKKVVTHYFEAPIRNTVSFILGGFISGIISLIVATFFCITIVGIPLGKISFGISKLILAPYHAEIVKK